MTGNNYFAHKNSLWQRIETEILPFVSKPGRYIGNELNAVVKDHKDRLKIALTFPDLYEIGMSYLGMQILYHILNKRDDCVAERGFLIWPDMEQLLRERQIPLFSLESSTPLKQFDVLSISVTYEMHAAGVLNILELSGIPFRAKDRDDSYPLVIAGGPAILNPEPLAEFFDVMALGDGEELINELADCLLANKDRSKAEKLKILAKIKGIYVPSLYQPEYKNGVFQSLTPIDPETPPIVNVRTCMELNRDLYPAKPIVPYIETTHDRLAIEIMRGCVNGCRFCQAGYQYRPQRPRKPVDLYSQIQTGYWATGFEDITLLSLSSTDYPELEQMIGGIMPFLQQQKISLSLPSIRPGSLSSNMMEYLKHQRKSGITFAPEGGTQHLRDVMGKNITEEEIYGGIQKAFDNDWTLVKLYFMIGIPGETDADIEGMIDMINESARIARAKGGKKNINITISPFIPKPGTPWQWEAQLNREQVFDKFNRILKGMRNHNVTLKLHDPNLSMIEGVLGRGDRRLADVIEKAYAYGARLDGWSEYYDFTRWEKALTECGFNLDDLLSIRFVHQKLPWEHIDKGISQKFLLDERDRSLNGQLPPGAEQRKAKATEAANTVSFGRTVKKRIAVSAVPTKSKIRIKYSRNESLRFYSHLDTIRMFNRTIRRAGLPISYSQGHHPHMKLSFGPPLPIGYSSEAEYLDIQLDTPFDKNHLSKLNSSLPPGMQISQSKLIFANVESLTKSINSSAYTVMLSAVPDDIEARVANLLASDSLIIKRIKAEGEKLIEARPLVRELSHADNKIEMLLSSTADSFVRPAEILVFGLGFTEHEAASLVFKRTGQYLLQGVHKVDPLDLV